MGTTGCGKSTLLRLLLGFEKPQKGSVYYDGKDISTVDLKSLRRRIGVVMQNGKLFSGDIFSNITIAALWLTMDDAWQAAELAGIAQDIRDMPMGMHTMISEGSGGISGGQRQRLMIARGIAAQIIYGGAEPIKKFSLKYIVEQCGIPAQHVQVLPQTQLLLIADGQYEAGNCSHVMLRK